MNNEYTHGHHESVLRSHRWRTAANSAGYLLPLLRPGMNALLRIAKNEGRSLAQVCELLLKGGILEYEKEGPTYLQRLLIRHKETSK